MTSVETRNSRRRHHIWIAAYLMTGCASAILPDGDLGASAGTETGNPPVVDARRVALVTGPDGMRLVGSAGAVKPGGTAIEVLDPSTAKVYRAESRADGSFEIALGEPSTGPLEVSAVSKTGRSSVVFVQDGRSDAGSDGGGDAGPILSACEQLSQLAYQRVRTAADPWFGAAPCSVDSDCAASFIGTRCDASCEFGAMSREGGDVVDTARSASELEICGNFDRAGCTVPLRPYCAGVAPACNGGECGMIPLP